MSNAELWKQYKENPTAELKKQLVLNYVNLVHYVIHKTKIFQIESALLDRRDLFQFGIQGLSEAIERFDPEYGTRFETYAIQRIRGSIYDELRKYHNLPNLETGETVDETKKEFKEDDLGMYEMIPTALPTGSEQILEKKDLKQKLLDLIRDLSEREQTILSLYYYEDLNYKEIAQVLSITVARVSQIHSKILNSLKLKLAEYNA
ncbi:MAG: RNA polymerase, sigma 28 subunit, FliA/WhiG subfamily [Parcubacteria group bacterium LiPW_41]|nr:MAG: RNA polymerase, sigma 28 subunit, FliA/WhiG subfamily [Parcubacteria group bacterium LiPW_41]